MRPLAGLAVAGAGSAVTILLGLLLPGSVLRYPNAIDAVQPLRKVYDFPGGAWVIGATLVALCAFWLLALRASARLTTRRGVSAGLIGTALLAGMFVFVYPTGSQDIFHNLMDARTLRVYGENPLVVPPSAHAPDPFARNVTAWKEVPAPYGPVAFAVALVPSWIGGDSLLGNLLAFKSLNALAVVLLAWVVGLAAGSLDPKRRVQAMVMVGWNPLVLYEAAGNGHNDVLMLVPLVASVLAASRHRPLSSFFAWAAAAGVKYVAGILAPALWLWLLATTTRSRRWQLIALALAGAGLVIGVRLWAGPDYQPFNDPRQFKVPPARSLAAVLTWQSTISLEGDAARLVVTALWTFAIALAAAALLRLNSSPRSLFRTSFWLLASLALLPIREVYPWYLLWFIPFGAVLLGSHAANLAVLASLSGLLTYAVVPFQRVWSTDQDTVYLAVFFGIPALYLAFARRFGLPTTGGYALAEPPPILAPAIRYLAVLTRGCLGGLQRPLTAHVPFAGGVVFAAVLAGLPMLRGRPMEGAEGTLPLFAGARSALGLVGLGAPNAENGATLGFLVVAGVGMYALGQWLFGRQAGLVAALAYLFARYTLTLVYGRQSLDDLAGIAMMPWAVWATILATRGTRPFHLAIGVLLVTALVLAGVALALASLPVLVLLVLGLAAWHRRPTAAGRGFACLTLGLVLAAPYWVPDLVQHGFPRTPSMDYAQPFIPLAALVAGPPGATPSRIGNLQLAAIPAAMLALPLVWRVTREGARVLVLLLSAASLTLPLAVAASLPLWENVPLLGAVRHPWRFLAVLVLAAALCCAALICLLASRWPRVANAATIVLVLGLFLAGFPYAHPDGIGAAERGPTSREAPLAPP